MGPTVLSLSVSVCLNVGFARVSWLRTCEIFARTAGGFGFRFFFFFHFCSLEIFPRAFVPVDVKRLSWVYRLWCTRSIVVDDFSIFRSWVPMEKSTCAELVFWPLSFRFAPIQLWDSSRIYKKIKIKNWVNTLKKWLIIIETTTQVQFLKAINGF